VALRNKRHQAFVDQYFLCNMNQTEAYMKVYPGSSYDSARANAARLIAIDSISEEIKRRLDEMKVSANEVLARLGEQARVNIGEFFIIEPVKPEDKPEQENPQQELEEVKEDDQQQQFSIRLDYHKIKEKGHLVKSLTWTQNGPKLELHDSQTALLNIGKNHGLFSDKHIVTLKVEQELEQFLDILERRLDPETYERVLAIISGAEAGQEEARPADPGQDDQMAG
jgi:phage terminase small subunit